MASVVFREALILITEHLSKLVDGWKHAAPSVRSTAVAIV